MHQSSSSPATIVIVAEDLLASLLQEWLTTAGYTVAHTHHAGVGTMRWQHLPVDLLIGELRYPVAERGQQLRHLQTTAFARTPPLLLIGPPPTLALAELPPGAAWMATPVEYASLTHLVRDLLGRDQGSLSHPADQPPGYGSLLQ